jgi:hypothetical protein
MTSRIQGCRWLAVLWCLLAVSELCHSQPGAAAEPRSRGGFSAGMGVIYVNAGDVVDLVNSTPGALERVPLFKTGVEFFGAGSIPIRSDWLVKIEYAYQLASFNIATTGGPAEFTVTIHCPTVIAQYVLAERGLYNLKLGAGGGFSFGSLSERYVYIDDSFTGSGPSFVLDLEANTAFGEDFYAFLGANARWQLIGELLDSGGRSPGVASDGGRPTLHLFGVGARLGFTYYVF